jgi:prepilin-type processing-associated H-X9-DG protein
VALSGAKLADIQRPSETIILFDSDQGKRNGSALGTAMPKPGRHNGGTNAAYVDGHVKWLKRD